MVQRFERLAGETTGKIKVLAGTLTFRVGAAGGVREAAWIKEPRSLLLHFL